MSNTIQHKRSTTSGTTPSASDLAVGEIGINTADRTLFTKHSDGTVVSVADVASDATPQLGGELDTQNNNIDMGTGKLKFDTPAPSTQQVVVDQGGHSMIQIDHPASGTRNVELNFENNGTVGTKLETTNTGATITGTLVADGLSLGDNEFAAFGASNDLTIQHSTSYGNIIGGNAGATRISLAQPGGYLSIDNGVFNSGFKAGAVFDPDGAQTLKYAGLNTLETQSTGVKVTGNVTVTDKIEHDGDTDTYIQFTDNKIGFTAGGVEKLAVNNISSPYNISIDANAFINADFGLNANSQSGGQSFNIFGSSFFASNIIDSPTGYDILINCPYDKRFRVHKGGYYQSGVPILQSSTGTTTDIGLYYGGNLKLITVSGGVNVTGDLTATGDVTAFSDARLKENVETIDNALEKVCGLRGVSYEKDGKKGIGVIAQEVEEVVPEVVGTHDDKDATRTVAYGNMVGVLIEAIKEQQQQIEDLKAKVTELGGYE